MFRRVLECIVRKNPWAYRELLAHPLHMRCECVVNDYAMAARVDHNSSDLNVGTTQAEGRDDGRRRGDGRLRRRWSPELRMLELAGFARTADTWRPKASGSQAAAASSSASPHLI